jgi:glycosyltransferase involved in cell wall biosynthesis
MSTLRIAGSRGIPANHGGFETFAERLAVHLSRNGWEVTVYCQSEAGGTLQESIWQGVKRIHIPVRLKGALGTVEFDLKTTWHAAHSPGLVLSLGYGTSIFSVLYRVYRRTNLINMDGLEWRRQKWSRLQRAWLYANERLGCWLGDHLIADHPAIKEHLATRVRGSKISMIAYGADCVESADVRQLARVRVRPQGYALVVGRIEPENSVLEIVESFSRKRQGIELLVLGRFDRESNPYHGKVLDAASKEVRFPGAIYDSPLLAALRLYAKAYIHGHQVGGTNPSLVEALGAGAPIIAHDNPFNRWVAGDGAVYFDGREQCEKQLDLVLRDDLVRRRMSALNRARHATYFTWDKILTQYEALLSIWQQQGIAAVSPKAAKSLQQQSAHRSDS